QTIVAISPFPFPGLVEMRDKYTYNITPWTQSVSSVAKRGLKLFYSDEDEEEYEDEDTKIAVATAFGFSGIFRKSSDQGRGHSPNRETLSVQHSQASRHSDHRENMRPNLDISALKKQYSRLRERQKQAHIILTASQLRSARSFGDTTSNCGSNNSQRSTPLTMNHLLRGKKALQSRARRTTPQGIIPSIPGVKRKIERKFSDTTVLHSQHRQYQQMHQEKLQCQKLQKQHIELQQRKQHQNKILLNQKNQNIYQPNQQLKIKKNCQQSKHEQLKQEKYKQKTIEKYLQQQTDQMQAQKTGSENSHERLKDLKRTLSPFVGPTGKVETLLWKDTERPNRRASLPVGIGLMEYAKECQSEMGKYNQII
ncbi:unnamed protein product, partial [Meganyctiphanes norvegica]